MLHSLLRELIRETHVQINRNKRPLLYHATCFPPESFIDGIDAQKSRGFGQGAGFYVFAEKYRALKHAKSLEIKTQDTEFAKEIDCPPGSDGKVKAYIVCIDEPITPKSFDIDYELYATAYIDFLIKHRASITPEVAKEIGVRKFLPEDNAISFFIMNPSPESWGETAHDYKGFSWDDLSAETSVDKQYAPTLSLSARRLSQLKPQLFNVFQSEVLTYAPALKYKGKKIIPHHIEDVQGNVVWSR